MNRNCSDCLLVKVSTAWATTCPSRSSPSTPIRCRWEDSWKVRRSEALDPGSPRKAAPFIGLGKKEW
jgi:hypothetical protein